MKAEIHPDYNLVLFRDLASGKVFLTRSTIIAKSMPRSPWFSGRRGIVRSGACSRKFGANVRKVVT